MKVVSKPISSPSRTEKFPPPLMRFLRSNGGSKSRGRSRSSPMFVRKKNDVIETQEPSSPKVTCIGQVRVRRSSKQFSRSKSGRLKAPPAKCPSFRVPKNLFCKLRKPKFRSFRPNWRKWVSFFRCGCCRKVNFRTDLSKVESNRRSHFEDSETEKNGENGDEDEESQVEEATEVFISSTPPKNAFLLTRCRSAPYRSSSLASQFWGSPQASLLEETEEDENEAKERCDFEEPERRLSSESGPNSRNSLAESRNDEESEEIPKQVEGIINGRNSEGSSQETKGNAAPLLILTRCKSEPAKTGERLINPENHQFLEPNKVGFC